MPIGIRPLVELPALIKEAVSNWINQGFRVCLSGTLDSSGELVASDVAGIPIAEPDYALSDTADILVLSAPARDMWITVENGDDGAGVVNAQDISVSLCFNPDNLAQATLYLTQTIAAPRRTFPVGRHRVGPFSTPVTSIGRRGLGTTLTGAIAKIEVIA